MARDLAGVLCGEIASSVMLASPQSIGGKPTTRTGTNRQSGRASRWSDVCGNSVATIDDHHPLNLTSSAQSEELQNPSLKGDKRCVSFSR
jgi:hypothetical protein